MEITEILKKKKFAITTEVNPPKGIDLREFDAKLAFIQKGIDGVNVTDQQAALMKLGSLAASIHLKQKGFNPIIQMTVRDRNRLALQSDLLSAALFGISNVLVLTGDPLKIGDHPDAKPVFDLDATGLMKAMQTLESGVDLAGKKLEGTPKFCIGAAANPCVDDLDTEFAKTHNKINNGAEFFQTQGVFDPDRFLRFMDRWDKEKIAKPVLAGIIILKSAKMAHFMNTHIPGVVIPPALISELEQA